MSGVSWVVSVICCFLCIARFSEQHEIFRLGQLFQEHVDLDITTFNIFQGETNLVDSLNAIFPKFYACIRNEIKESPSVPRNLLQIQGRWFAKYLLHLDQEATLSALSKISQSEDIIRGIIQPLVLVYWPTPIPDKVTAQSILNQETLKLSTRGFSIASLLIFAFNKNSTSEDIHENFMFFEVYTINGYYIAEDIDSKGVLDFNCRYCRGPAIRRHNLFGANLNITGVEDPELNDDLHYDELPSGELVIKSDGFSAKVLDILQRSLNFTVKAFKSVDWGRPSSNGTWIGAVKDVADGTADMSVAITIMRPNRAELVHFLPALDEHVISAFFRPSDFNQIRDIFVRPFHPDLWAAVISTWFVLAFFMILFSVIRKRYGMHENLEEGTVEPDFINDSFIWALATACQQGWDDHPVAGSLRTIFISGSFTGVVAYAGYSAAIVSTLSLKVDPIQNPTELLHSHLKIGIRDGFLRQLLEQNETNDIITRFQTRVHKPDGYVGAVVGYEKVRTSSYAFISTRDTVYDLLKLTPNNKSDEAICSLKEIRILTHGFPLSHFLAKTSPYKEMFRYLYVTIREPGVSWKLRNNYTYTRRCLEASDNTGQKLGLNDVFTAFMILAAGFVFSGTFLTIEKLFRVGKSFSYMR